MDRVRNYKEESGQLPEGYDYSDISVRNALASMWALEMTNTFNQIATFDYDSFLVDYEAIKEQMIHLPSIQQENSIMQIMGMLTRAASIDFEAYRQDTWMFTTGEKETATTKEDYFAMHNFKLDGIFVQAINGGGKTTVMMRAALLLDKYMESVAKDKSLNITLVSPSEAL